MNVVHTARGYHGGKSVRSIGQLHELEPAYRKKIVLCVKEKAKVLKRISKAEVMLASGVTGKGVEQILYRIISILDEEKAAAEAGFSWRTIERVKKQCSVRSIKRNGVWCWVLA